MLFVTHSIPEAVKIGSRILLVSPHPGQVRAELNSPDIAMRAEAARSAGELEAKAGEIIGRTRAQLVTRAASFMLLADSKASFEIEGERPPRSRLERWGRAILQSGRNRLTLELAASRPAGKAELSVAVAGRG